MVTTEWNVCVMKLDKNLNAGKRTCKMNVPFIVDNHLRSLGLITQKIKE